jgi:hypothetical protein
MVALHSAVLDSITLYTPWTHRAVLHPHVCTATGRVRLTPSRHLSLSPLRLHDPYTCRGRAGALHACSYLRALAGGVWRVDTRVRRHQRGLRVFGRRRVRPPAHTPCTPKLHSKGHPLSLQCTLLSHSNVSTLQLRSTPHPVQGGECRSRRASCIPGCPSRSSRSSSLAAVVEPASRRPLASAAAREVSVSR